MSARSPAAAAEPNPASPELVPVEGRTLEQVGELRPVGRIVDRELALPTAEPRPRARASRRVPAGASYEMASSALPAIRKPIGCRCSSARCASSPAVRASTGMALTLAAGKPRSSMTAAIGRETFMVRGLPQAAATAGRNSRASKTCGPLMPRASASSRMRSARGSSGRCTGWPNPGARSPAAWIARAISSATAAGAPPASTFVCASASRRAHTSAVPRMTGPQPRIPAATAPCSDSGSAASVMRAATLVGIIPCSAMATRTRSRK